MRCKCKQADVTTTDHAFVREGILFVHGKEHCYTAEQYRKPVFVIER